MSNKNKKKENVKKISAANFFDIQKQIYHYNEIYSEGKPNFKELYPANLQRLNIFLSILNNIKPKTIVDAGCGNGFPLLKLLKDGFKASGYDKSKNMIKEAKKKLSSTGYDSSLATVGDFENPTHIENESLDCVTGMGTFYYAKDFKQTIIAQRSKLKTGGHLIFSLRNRLFDLCTLNNYTTKFLYELYDISKKDEILQSDFFELTNFVVDDQKNFLNIDDEGVSSTVHNPLTINKEIADYGLRTKNIYFYHYHALPPKFEHKYPNLFRQLSWDLEDPLDWKGYFLASGFIVHAIKS